jgi:hypothetical protein
MLWFRKKDADPCRTDPQLRLPVNLNYETGASLLYLPFVHFFYSNSAYVCPTSTTRLSIFMPMVNGKQVVDMNAIVTEERLRT